ncbi:MAG: hypothetical protein IPG94_21525 [Kineosporiaceae bacterium]|nr:hypothetical protein [Kineosporiaceae bacterium]
MARDVDRAPDLSEDDVDAAAERAVALGRPCPSSGRHAGGCRADPAGHPFCLTSFTPDSVS